jgi:hypothetical protein
MFPGFGVSKKGWDTHYEKGTDSYVKTDFISKLKKMGTVYFHEPLYHNIKYYIKNYKSKFLYDENIDFTKENLDVSKECEKVYEKIKDFNGMFIPIGHSIGAYFLYCFQKKYSSRCLFSVIIDGSPLGPISQTLNDEKKLYPKIEKYQKYDDVMINKLKEKLYKNDEKALRKLADIAFYNIFKYKEITNKAEKFNKPLIEFYNIDIKDDKKSLKKDHFLNLNRIKEIEYFKKHNNDYVAIAFINKTHYPHYIDESREIILKSIKEMINKYSYR